MSLLTKMTGFAFLHNVQILSMGNLAFSIQFISASIRTTVQSYFQRPLAKEKKYEKYCEELWWFESLPQSDHWRQPLRHSATDAKVADASMSLPLLSIQSTKPKEGDK